MSTRLFEMLPRESKDRLSARAPLDALVTPRAAVAAMLDFYADVRPGPKLVHEEGDMLLYEWGPHRTPDGAETFRIGLTRQFIVFPPGADEGSFEPEDGMSHLILALHWAPSACAGRGQRWCATPVDLPALRAFIDASPPYQMLADTAAERVELDWSPA